MVNDLKEHVIVYFPIRPPCFLLRVDSKVNYKMNCDISDSNTKMINIMKNFSIFRMEMEYNINQYRNQRF